MVLSDFRLLIFVLPLLLHVELCDERDTCNISVHIQETKHKRERLCID